ncbi:uncharacterized protein N7506_001958 [Penicillium brevicompactum]|uniref:uncharacterized protein n=1 Tax=Penicillium brevicompactum TaxID=5074 RepID=UPI002540B84C|nr:uncharacterized protein N7506_001958 [Penicillium brevicompactum]KAJ5348705.1 hypothetical protein N7506_001958 [Penicillium brevicompactum]
MSSTGVEHTTQYPTSYQPHQQLGSHNPYNPQSGYVGQSQQYNDHYGQHSTEPFNRQTNSSPYQQQQYGANAYYYNPESQPADFQPSEDERGLGSTVTGGAAGGYAAHQMGGGKLATAGGALLGAVGMNMATHK